ncbi:hypothetical protein SAMN02910369_00689 [Lachnospiraceae bacterium NE2001]|nr:hypothetical protein SAMN02910369_00689 [Lachnospiraceae bacterium NE2001]
MSDEKKLDAAELNLADLDAVSGGALQEKIDKYEETLAALKGKRCPNCKSAFILLGNSAPFMRLAKALIDEGKMKCPGCKDTFEIEAFK